MNKILAGAVAGAAVCAAIFGAGTAHAVDEYKGMTYADVVSSIGSGNAVIVSRVGEYLPTDKCIVSGSRKSIFADTSGNPSGGGKVLLDLNCNDLNNAGHPGYSAMTPAGKKAQQLRDSVKAISQNFEEATAAGQTSWCEEQPDMCTKICTAEGAKCTADLMSFLGL